MRNARSFALTGHFLATGQIDVQKASTIVSMLEDYPAEIAVLVQDTVIDDAGLQTHSQLVAAIRKALIAVSHGDADRLHAKARAERRVDHSRQLLDGMVSMLAILPATDAVALDLALEAAARTARANGDQRTLDQLRADTLALMGHAALENGYVGLPTNPSGTPAPQPSRDGDGAGSDDEAAAPDADPSSAGGSKAERTLPASADPTGSARSGYRRRTPRPPVRLPCREAPPPTGVAPLRRGVAPLRRGVAPLPRGQVCPPATRRRQHPRPPLADNLCPTPVSPSCLALTCPSARSAANALRCGSPFRCRCSFRRTSRANWDCLPPPAANLPRHRTARRSRPARSSSLCPTTTRS